MKTKAMRNDGSDEFFTPKYAIYPLKEYIQAHWWENPGAVYLYDKEPWIIWCPFDTEDSNYVKLFRKWGHTVICSHIDEGKDFFKYEPKKYDVIISNPPFSMKTKILKRLFELKKPFAMLLPLTVLEGIERGKMYKKHADDMAVMIFDKRVNFIKGKSNYFNSCYITYRFLGNRNLLIFKTLNKKEQDD